MTNTTYKQSTSNPNRWIVRSPGEPAFVAERCITCQRITALELIHEGECARCDREQAA